MRGFGTMIVAAVVGAVIGHVLERPVKGLVDKHFPKVAPPAPPTTKEG